MKFEVEVTPPKWAKWLVQFPEGDWWWYETKPKLGTDSWHPPEKGYDWGCAIEPGSPNENWRTEIYEIIH